MGETPRGQWHLPDPPPLVLVLVNEAAEWLTGELEAERTDAQIVVETFFGQDVERPQIAPTEPPRGRRYPLTATPDALCKACRERRTSSRNCAGVI